MAKSVEKELKANIPQWKEGKYIYKGVVNYGMSYIYNNRVPYFHITADIYYGYSKGEPLWREHSFGMQQDLIKERMPHLIPLLAFHGWGQDGLPIHYHQNGYYWYKEDREVFKDYVLVQDDEVIPESTEKQVVIDWLNSRKERIQQLFVSTMEAFNIPSFTQEEIEAIKVKNKAA